jgi:hypothetical protein
MSKNYTGLSALYDKLSQACKEVYEGNEFIDPSCGYEINDRGVFKLLEDGKITVDKLLDVCDVELDWYIPSNFAIEFILFIRLALGEEPENSNPKATELKEYLADEIKKLDSNINIPIIFVRESSVLEDSLFDCEYVETKAGNNRFKRHIYRNAIEDMIELKKTLEN